jgi:hypothetical protein
LTSGCSAAAVIVTVVDSRGEPFADVSVEALQATTSAGQRTFRTPAATGTTSDLGTVRLFGLEPGEYFIAGRPGASAPRADDTTAIRSYFPGTLAAADAQPVSVRTAQESNVVLPITTAKGVRLSGVVRRWSGASIVSSESLAAASLL